MEGYLYSTHSNCSDRTSHNLRTMCLLYDTKRQNPIKFVCAVVAVKVFFHCGLKSRRMGLGRGGGGGV